MNEPNYDTNPTYGMRNALRLVLLFYHVGRWDQERRDEWRRLTGTTEASTKVLCDHVRSALAIGACGDAAEGERLWGLSAGHVLTERDVEDIKNIISAHNDEIRIQGENFQLGRIRAFHEVGGRADRGHPRARLAVADEAAREHRQDALAEMGRWPSNIWLGITAEDQAHYHRRWERIQDIPAAVRFISYEPAIGPLMLDSAWSLTRLPHWIICGGESGHGARTMNPTWARDLRDVCASSGVAFFMKQMTGKAPIPEDLMVREFPR